MGNKHGFKTNRCGFVNQVEAAGDSVSPKEVTGPGFRKGPEERVKEKRTV